MDVKIAFLNSDLKENVYMKYLEEFAGRVKNIKYPS